MSTLLSPIREFFRKGDVLLLSLCLIASGFGLLLIFSVFVCFFLQVLHLRLPLRYTDPE